ncbi:MAG: hypothetical protein ABFS05_10115 [Bacteroidota bacterium]
MNKIFKLLLIAILAISVIEVQAQDEDFKPHGKPVIKVFADYHSIFTDGEAKNAFRITRAYVGYQYSFSKNFSAKVVMDFGDPAFGKFQLTAYLKNAYLKYKYNKLTASFGMIGTTGFKVQEDFWGYRYIYKSFQDAYRLNPSADLGLTVKYDFFDFLSADFSLFNGDGYKIIKVDTALKVAGGVTATPLKGLILRVYYDYMKREAPEQTISVFAGYTFKKIRLGGEYNHQLNHGMIKDKDFSGYSIYSAYQLHKRWSVFARYDNLYSEKMESTDENPWNFDVDGQLIMAGFDYSPVKGVKLAINYRGWVPTDSDNSLVHGAYLNVEFKL